MARDERRESQEEAKIIEEAAMVLRSFKSGDGSPIAAHFCAERLGDIDTTGDSISQDAIVAAIHALEECEDGEEHEQGELEQIADSLESILGGR